MQKNIRCLFAVIIVLLLIGSIVAVAQRKSENKSQWQVGKVISEKELRERLPSQWFSVQPLPDAVFARMQGKSYPQGCKMPRKDLRYLRLLHYDLDGQTRTGEMVCNVAIAADVMSIMQELYRQRYPIHSIRLIDDFDADDERSMRANNSSSFCYRKVAGSSKLSAHSLGMAVDLNTLYNPYYKKLKDGRELIQPGNARAYCNRSASFPYKIDRQDLAYKLFVKHGFKWGGAWKSLKDYQHFEK